MELIGKIIELFIKILGRDALRNISTSTLQQSEDSFESENVTNEETEDIGSLEIRITDSKDIKSYIRKIYFSLSAIAAFFAILDDFSLITFLKLEVILIAYVIFFLITTYIGLKSNIEKTFNFYINKNRIDPCIDFLKKCMKAYPDFQYVKLYFLYSLFIGGKFETYKVFCKENQLHNVRDPSMNSMGYCIAYFNGSINEELFSEGKNENNTLLDVSQNLIASLSNEKNSDIILENVSILTNSSINLYKTLGFLIKAEIYTLGQDLVSQQQYIEKALEYSPSEEVTECIQKHIEAMNTQSA